ncbi:MAG: hypothetical protein OXP66_06255 [Candidatus Tectomicrobia bacterium]|nr:hypothetical protein [Candidatus Tectomicrobia bacterium]
MEIVFNREQAMKALDVGRNFAERASGLKVLQGAFLSAGFGRVRLTTTNLSLWCQVVLDAQTVQPGTALVPVRQLGTVLKNAPHSRVTLRSVEDDLVCEAGPSVVRLSRMDPEEYPEIDPPDGRLLTMPLPAGLVDRVAYAASRDETRYTLTGVCLDVAGRQMKLVATDGHRLARFTGGLPPGSVVHGDGEPLKAIIPVGLLSNGVRLGGKLGGATLELHEKAAGVCMNGAVRIWANLIEGPYPAYEGLIPSEYAGTIAVPKGALCSAVARLGALSKGRRPAAVALEVDGSQLVLRLAADAGDGIAAVERVAPARITGTVPVCALRINYLSDALARLPDVGWAAFRFTDEQGESLVAIQGSLAENTGLLAMVMPCKV